MSAFIKEKIIKPVIISVVGVFVIDYLSHMFFSSPMETFGYFLAKMAFYIIFSIIFLSVLDLNKNEFIKVAAGGVAVSSLWGMYYNIFPIVFDYYPFGIPLAGLNFLGMGLLGTGIAFGIIHTLAFLGGYYSGKTLLK